MCGIISYLGPKQCKDILLEDCRAEGNRGLGFHPGSGSTGPVMRRLIARNNGRDGFFYCLRVSFGVLEDSESINNGGHGIPIYSFLESDFRDL